MVARTGLLLCLVATLGVNAEVAVKNEAKPAAVKPEAAQAPKSTTVAKSTTKKETNACVVNAMETMQACEHGREKLAGIEKKRKDLGDTIEKKEQQLKQKMTEYKSKESTLSVTAREKEEATLVKMRRDFESLVQSSEDELKLAMQRATEELSKEIEEAAAVVARDGGYDIVVDVYTGRTIWASADVVKTADLVKVMDKKHRDVTKKTDAKVTA